MSGLGGYRTGGTVHIVVNNQVGFTTGPQASRTSQYSTDYAKIIQAPVFHVNGDDPEACVQVARLAFEYRQEFNKDVVIDMICYRRRGHNEGDEPSFTQPLMYQLVDAKRSTRTLYTEALVGRGDITPEEAEEIARDYQTQLESVFASLTNTDFNSDSNFKAPVPPAPTAIATAITESTAREIAATHSAVPEGFHVHPKLTPQLAKRVESLNDATIDWSTGEMLAFGSLLKEGHPIRLAGQDSRRGTFSNRHAVIIANGAQTIIDEFISSALQKWGERSSVVLLLPHGYEGQGPDHSSARIERYLQLCAEQNMTVAQPASPANYFHLLRWHAKNPTRRPLIVFTPKSMLRLKAAASALSDFTSGYFQPVIGDATVNNASRVIFCSGKIYHDLVAERAKMGENSTAIVRVELLYPLPIDEMVAEANKHPNANLLWVQDEPANQGPWSHIALRTSDAHGGRGFGARTLRRISRRSTASPATGSHHLHEDEQKALLLEAFTR
jgi:2-oxoglutarate dehydrogenase E1 component